MLRRSAAIGAAIIVAVSLLAAEPATAKPAKPASWGAKSITVTRQVDAVTVSFRARKNTKRYYLVAALRARDLPSKLKKRSTSKYKVYSVRQASGRISIRVPAFNASGMTFSSAAGNVARFRLFAVGPGGVKRAAVKAWRAPSSTTSKNWLPVKYAALPAPLPVTSGVRTVPLRVATYNVHNPAEGTGTYAWSRRVPRIAAVVKRHKPAIIAFQESGHRKDWSMFNLIVSAMGSNYRSADSRYWCDVDPAYCDRKKFDGSAQDARIAYDSTQVTMEARGFFRSTHMVRRGASWTKFRLRQQPDATVCVLNVHLLAGQTSRAALTRKRAAQETLDYLRTPAFSAACANSPLVMGADLNTFQHSTVGHAAYTVFTKAGFADTYNADVRLHTKYNSVGESRHYGFGGVHPRNGVHPDYILTRGTATLPVPAASAVGFDTTDLKSRASDHLLYWANLRIPYRAN